MAFAAFQEFAPDRSVFAGPSANVVNAIPRIDGWGPMPLHEPVPGTTALPLEPRGGISVRSEAGVWYTFAGTAEKLYYLAGDSLTPTDITRLSGDYNLGDEVFWSFHVFGNRLIATALGSGFPQYVDLASMPTNFDDLPNADFEAELVWGAGDFLVFGRIDGNNRTLEWSGINDSEYWEIGSRGCDYQELPDGGDIQVGFQQALNALIGQQNCIRQMVFAPDSGVVFTIPIIDPAHGIYAQRSVANIGTDDFVFLAKDGFYRNNTPIGEGRVDRWFFATADSPELTEAVVDPFAKIVWFRFVSEDQNRLLGFDYKLDRWCYSDQDLAMLMPAATAGFTLEDLDAFGDLDSLPYSLDSRFWKGGLQGFAGFDSSFNFGFLSGDNAEAIIDTEIKQLNYPRRSITDRTFVLVDTNDVSVAIGTKEKPGDMVTFGSYTAAGIAGWVAKQKNGRFHQFRVKIAEGAIWNHATGIDCAFTDGGLW